MKTVFWLTAAWLMALPLRAAAGGSNPQPNVIVVLSDDQGYGDFSCHGNPVLQTPALDRLHAESVRLGNFHVSPLCTPTRSQLLTGMDALHNGASTVLTGRGLLRRDLVTMPEVFRRAGYQTGLFGKWHLGDVYPDRPMDRGFQKSVWVRGWGLLSEVEFDNDYYRTRYLDSLDTRYSQKYCTDLWFDEAMQWMDGRLASGTPFFTYIALNAPHGPFHAPEEEASPYRSKVAGEAAASFLGMIRNIDRNMERLDAWLETRKAKENTVVIFMNDNGGTAGVDVYNAGLRGKKGSNYDGGHRAACFIRWPAGTLGPPRTVDYPATIQDLLPTFIDLFGLSATAPYAFDGRSLKPVLRPQGRKLEDRLFVVQYTGGDRPVKWDGCVVWNRWRLVGEGELYDTGKDPGQLQNVAAQHSDVVKKMQAFYESWWTGVEPLVDSFIPVVVGSAEENPVLLTSNGWAGQQGVNTQWAVAQGSGPSQGGVWHLQVEEPGRYLFEMSRWPFHLERSMVVEGPGVAVGGTALRKGKALPVAAACLKMNEGELVVRKAEPGASSVSVILELPRGRHQLQAWFRDGEGADLCGAYYVRARRL